MDHDVVATWLCAWVAVICLASRLPIQHYVGFQFKVDDYLCLVGIFMLIAYVSLSHIVIVWGNNNIPSTVRQSIDFTPREIYRREVGSKITLVIRVLFIHMWVSWGMHRSFFKHHWANATILKSVAHEGHTTLLL